MPAVLLCLTLLTADGDKKELSPAEKKQLQSLVAEFGQTKDTNARLRLVRRAGDIGSTAVEPLLEIVGQEWNKELVPYRQAFMKVAAEAAAERVNVAAAPEINQLRVSILELLKREDLTEEMILKVTDPAFDRLKELILIDRREVFKRQPKLEEHRAAMASLGRQWETCARTLLFAIAREKEEEEKKALKKQEEKNDVQADEQELLEEEQEKKGRFAGRAVPPPSFENYLLKEEEMATALAMPMDPSTRQVFDANSQMEPRLDPEEARCILDLNLTRILLGLPPMEIDLSLVLCARDHSKDMHTLNFFSHLSPVEGKMSVTDRAGLFNTSTSAENIASGAVDGSAVNRLWWHSPGHHKNMLGDYRRVGVGRVGTLWTEMFGN